MEFPRVLVLGGSGYIGSHVVSELARRDVPLALTYCSGVAQAESLHRETGAAIFSLDVRERGSMEKLFATLDEQEFLPNVVIHCIGTAVEASIAELDSDQWDESHRVNVHSVVSAVKEASARMRTQGGGTIVLTSTMASLKAVPVPVCVAGADGAKAGLTRSLSKELGPLGIRINLVSLGVLNEGFSKGLSDQLREDYERFSALRRIGTAQEAAKAIVGVALESPYMTGATVCVDGGV